MAMKASGVLLVEEFFNALEEGDIKLAKSYMSGCPLIIFPGGVEFTSLDDMLAAGQNRYRFIRKVSRNYFSFADNDYQTVVVQGFLEGLNLHGEEFSEVRFIDLFRLEDGKIVKQEIWNDLKERDAL